MKEPIRIAQIIGNANAGGVESVIMNLYKNIDTSRYQFDFFVQQTCPIISEENILPRGGKIVYIPPVKKIFKYQKELTRLFKEGNYQIVHSNMNTLSVFTLKAAKKAGVPIRIAHSHSTSSKKEFVRNVAKSILKLFSKKYATHFFACSEKAGRYQFGNKAFDQGKVIIINNSIDTSRFMFNLNSRNEIRKQFDIPSDTLLIGHVGRMVTVKNHSYLLDVFKHVKEKHENSKLLLVGYGPLKEDIQNKAKALNIEKDVIFAGVFKDTSKFYSAFDVFCLPSLYEGLPVVAVEAECNGVITYISSAATRETKIIDKCEFLSIEESPSVWAERIINANLDYDRKPYSKVLEESKFNIKKSTNTLMDLYDSFLREKENGK